MQNASSFHLTMLPLEQFPWPLEMTVQQHMEATACALDANPRAISKAPWVIGLKQDTPAAPMA